MTERLRHIIEAQQFDRSLLEGELFPLANEMERTASQSNFRPQPLLEMLLT